MDKMMRIRGEIPTFKRCCMCLPLRHGLIVWGYIRLGGLASLALNSVIGVILLVGVTKIFLEVLGISKEKEGYEVYVVLFAFFVTLAGADIVLSVVFVYAGHTKDLKMLRAYYIYSFILWVLMVIMGISVCVYAVYMMKLYEMEASHVFYTLWDLSSYLAQILIQAYVLLLVRSEFIKLSKNCEFRFVNNAAESACEIKCGKQGYGDDGTVIDERNSIAISETIAHEDITAKIHIHGGKDRVYKNETSESNDSIIY